MSVHTDVMPYAPIVIISQYVLHYDNIFLVGRIHLSMTQCATLDSVLTLNL